MMWLSLGETVFALNVSQFFFQLKEGRDDLGRGNSPVSLQTGNSGRPIACCVVGLADSYNWDNPFLRTGDFNPVPVNPVANSMTG